MCVVSGPAKYFGLAKKLKSAFSLALIYLSAMMTPKEHADIIAAAKAADRNESLYGIKWWLFEDKPKNVDEIDPRRQHMSDAVGRVVFDHRNGERARVSLSFYDEVWNKLAHYGPGRVLVRCKGGNAAAIQMGLRIGPQAALDAGFNFSDLDMDILINPALPARDFEEIRANVHRVLRQALATHKRRLDRAFFKPRDGDPEMTYMFRQEAPKEAFRAAVCESVETLQDAQCCFSSAEARNKCSNISFLITPSNIDSVAQPGTKRRVKIEQPHLDKAERIPLTYTPFYVSVNDTVCGVRDNGDQVDLTLFRIKMSQIVNVPGTVRVGLQVRGAYERCGSPAGTVDEDVESALSSSSDLEEEEYVVVKINTQPYDKVSADFIDVCVPNRADAELNSFARRGGFQGFLSQEVRAFGFVLILPTLAECKLEYYKLLHVFECPESKRAKRERKYAALVAACNGRL